MNYLVVSLLGEKKKKKRNLIILEILGTEADHSETKVEFRVLGQQNCINIDIVQSNNLILTP